jgi:predicted kinase
MLYIIRGLPGSGKTTYAKIHYPNTFHIEADMFHVRGGEYLFELRRLGMAHELCMNIVGEVLRTGADAVVSNTFIAARDIKRYIGIAEFYDMPYIVIRCTGSFGSIHNVPEETMENMRRRFVDFPGEILV